MAQRRGEVVHVVCGCIQLWDDLLRGRHWQGAVWEVIPKIGGGGGT